MTTTPVLPPTPDRTIELRAKGWTHHCEDLVWHPVAGHKDTEGAVCVECGSAHYRWSRRDGRAAQ